MRAVFERDFLSEAVRPRTFAFRSAVAIAVAAVILVTLRENLRLLSDSPDQAARELYRGGAFALLGALAVLTPPAVVGAVLEERQRETLALVLSAPIGPRGFAAAKVLSRSMSVLTWALAALLPLSMITLLGGVGAGQILDLACISFALVLELAAWGVLVSAFTRKLATGAVLGFVLPYARWILFAGIGAAVASESRGPEAVPAWIALMTTPAAGAFDMAEPADYRKEVLESLGAGRGRPVYSGGPAFYGTSLFNSGPPAYYLNPVGKPAVPWILRAPALAYLLFALGFAAVAITVSGRRLDTEAEPRDGFFTRWLRRKRRARPPPRAGNPMAWKESRLLNTASSRPLYYSMLGVMAGTEIACVLASAGGNVDVKECAELANGTTAAFGALLGLVAAITSAAAMAHERSTGTLDLLRASPLTPAEILRGKLAGIFRGLGILGLLPLFHQAIFVATDILDPLTALLGAGTMAVQVLFWGGVGMWCGITTFRLARAVTTAAMLFGVALVGVPLLAVTAHDILRAREAGEFLLGACPPAAAYMLLDGSWQLVSGQTPDSMSLPGVLWTAAYAVGGVVWYQFAPAILARQFDRERDG